jgi:hypothetical protein
LLPLIAIHPQEGVMKSSGLQCSSKITEALPAHLFFSDVGIAACGLVIV